MSSLHGTTAQVPLDPATSPSARLDDIAPDAPGESRISDLVGPAITFCLFIGVWYLIAMVLLPPHKRFLLPPPHRVITEGSSSPFSSAWH